jgi:hypothetical protein
MDGQYADRKPWAQYDAQGHRIADEGFNQRTVYLNDAERRERTVQFAGGKILGPGVGATGEKQPVTTKGATALTIGSSDKHLFTMLPSGEFVMADAGAEMERLKRTPQQDLRFHHSSLAQGKEVAAAGEMTVDNGELQKISDGSGHYRPRADLTRQAVAELSKRGIPIERAELELLGKEEEQGVRGGALEILGYEAGDKDIQKKMLAARALKQNVLADVKRLGDKAGGGSVAPSSLKGPSAPPPGAREPLVTHTKYDQGPPALAKGLATHTKYDDGPPALAKGLATHTKYDDGPPALTKGLGTKTNYLGGPPALAKGLGTKTNYLGGPPALGSALGTNTTYHDGPPALATFPSAMNDDDNLLDEGLDGAQGAAIAGGAHVMAGTAQKKKRSPLARAHRAMAHLFGGRF